MIEGRTDGRTDGRTEGRTDGRTDGQTDDSDFIECCPTNVERPLYKKYARCFNQSNFRYFAF